MLSRRHLLAAGGGLLLPAPAFAQPVRRDLDLLRDRALADKLAWELTESLTTEIGPRPVGSPAMARARDWGVAQLKRLRFQNVAVETFRTRAWSRGAEAAQVVGDYAQPLRILGLGGSPSTPPGGLTADIAVFPTFQALLDQPEGALAGKIAVVTQRMQRTQDPSGYFFANARRSRGPGEAAKRGAVAYLLRSLSTDDTRLPHTGGSGATIPAAALAGADAELLERLVARGKPVRVRLDLASSAGEVDAYNIVGEIRGREAPDEVIVVGGHLDSWDVGQGAVDNAAGVAITTAAASLAAARPLRRTVRVVMWGSEEQGGSSRAYAAAHAEETPRMVVVGESDSGAATIWNAALPPNALKHPAMQMFREVLGPLGVGVDTAPARDGGADISGLVRAGAPFVEFRQDLLRYFDLHHSEDDTLDKVDPAQLAQNVAVWATFIRLAADSDIDFRKLAST